ncbi:lysophospholipid acyltransferase family protein [Rothia sp. CCM 9417]|uniref:lysophospholipid acyltransferase family protein n=1 Tax=unclassified Rothia (in: high G+C Gram-positive bacteria) TaxID=2689056 RepID=UPI003AC9C5ED
MSLKYKATQKSIEAILRTVFRARVTGLENFPAQGPVILASNHLAFLDSVIISALMPRRVAFLAKAEYVNSPGFKGRAMKTLFQVIDIIPVNRTDKKESMKALETALERLEEGKVFGIYPEGTRSRDGYLYKGKIGVAWLAHMTGARVVPVGLIGTDKIQKPGSNMVYPHRFTVRVGEPLIFEKLGEKMSGRQRRETTDTIMDAIAQLSGQARKNEYNVSPSAERDSGSL